MSGCEYLPHVSDVRIRAWGDSLEETFAEVCLGMWALVVPVVADVKALAARPGIPARIHSYTRASASPTAWDVSVTASDLDELLVNLLNEQIARFDSEGLVATAVESLSVRGESGAWVAQAVLQGCRVVELPMPPARSLKAATYQDLRVSPQLVEVTLDV